MGFFNKLKEGLGKTRNNFNDKINDVFSAFRKVDEDLLEYVFDEGEFLEPIHYLPIIPVVLTSRNEGMAPGYKFSSFSYNPIDIIALINNKLIRI